MKNVYRNIGLFSLAVLFLLIYVNMKDRTPEHLAEKVTDHKPLSDQLDALRSLIVAMIEKLNDEKPETPVHESDKVADNDHVNTQSDKSQAATLLDQLNSEKVQQDDPRLIKLIRDHFIEPPSPLSYRLNDISRNHYSQFNQSAIVDTMLKNVETGFFVECGGYDGEAFSNTLYFEKTRHWRGLLIEADPTMYAKLKKKNRNAFTINACLSLEHYPVKMPFNKHAANGRLLHDEGKQWMAQRGYRKQEIQVQCFPLYSILLALNQTNVDYLSLDIEGDELYALKTVPFDKVQFKLMTVEVNHPANRSVEFKAFMGGQGYQHVRNIAIDMVFVRKGAI